MDKITPHLWFDREAVEAAEFYTATFPDSKVIDVTTIPDTPSGDTDVVTFQLCGQTFQAISAGPLFSFNPSVSFAVSCDTVEEVDGLWTRLADGGTALMPLDTYPFSERYGWIQDRYGLSWQIAYAGDGEATQRITPTLMFVGQVCGKAEEAIALYTSVFPTRRSVTSSATAPVKSPTSGEPSSTRPSGWRVRSSPPWTALTTTSSGSTRRSRSS